MVREQGYLAAYQGEVLVARKDSSGVVWWSTGWKLNIDWAVENESEIESAEMDLESNTTESAKVLKVKDRGLRLFDKVTGRFVSSKK